LKAEQDLKNIFIDVNLQLNCEIFLDRDIQNRLKKVMRFKKGWQFAVFNGKDGLFLAQVLDSDCEVIKLIEKLKEHPCQTQKVLFLPILKKEALSNAVRQATELGIDIIQPIITKHTVENDFKYDRYQQIALGAAEQSERLTLVEFKETLDFSTAINNFEHNIFWACERLEGITDKQYNFKHNDGILVGPEGGFANEEKEFLLSLDKIVAQTLGKAILKADTAIVASVFKFNELCD
jgi:16S rRNA (uracil1498-N3)-methyltransferase